MGDDPAQTAAETSSAPSLPHATAPPIQLVGLTAEPLDLQSAQIHGDRRLLITQPQTLRLEIRPAATAPHHGGSKHHDGGPLHHWRPFTGRCLPESTEILSPTLFRSEVYRSFQHAMLALLFWSSQGEAVPMDRLPLSSSAPLLLSVRDGSPQAGPPFIIPDASTVVLGPMVDAGAALLVQLLSQEPSAVEVAEHLGLLQAMTAGSTPPPPWGLLLLVGSLRPGRSSSAAGAAAVHHHPAGAAPGSTIPLHLRRPVLHGILLRCGPNGEEEVQHGWYPCVQQGRLWFAYQGLHEGARLAPLLPPNLAGLNLRLWRKGQATFCIGPRHITLADTQDWDERIRLHLLSTVVARGTTSSG